MAKRGRPPLEEPRTRIGVRIKTRLLAQLDLLMLDPMREGVKYGARNEYIEALIEADLERLTRARADEQHLRQVVADGPEDLQELYRRNDE